MIKRKIIFYLLFLAIATTAGDGSAESTVSRRTPVVEAFEKNKDAVVSIASKYVVQELVVDDVFGWGGDFGLPFRQQEREVTWLGSGFVINAGGYIVTNAHVVRRADEITVIMADNTEYKARKVAEDNRSDLALLKIESDKPFPTVTLGRSDDLMIGETVLAIGNPFGYQHTLTGGILSSIHRDVELTEELVLPEMLQISAPINPGNSGGPLLNIRGEVIGINTAIRRAAQGIGFAIPIDQLCENLPKMINIERLRRIDFGLTVSNLKDRKEQGIKVDTVRSDSAAEAAGFKPGHVIIRVDDKAVGSATDFYLDMLERRLDTTVSYEVRRQGERERSYELKLTLRERPQPDGNELARRLFGLELGRLTQAIIKRYHLAGETGDVVVMKVEKGSPAYYAHIEAGDILLSLDGIVIKDIEQLGYKLETLQSGSQVKVAYTRTENIGSYILVKQYTTTLRPRGDDHPADPAGKVFDL
ncbi:MAG: trypsin-like peptidase domain-containing protein [Sedimentisphaerales bacterium]|nr:trypsin-like peptidase domain-containing protein [Sedimentisphaerales bacterium]